MNTVKDNLYYSAFTSALPQEILDASEALTAQRERVVTIRDNLSSERHIIERLEVELEQARGEATQTKKTSASESLRASIQSMKDKIARLKNDLEVSRDMVQALDKQLPIEQKEADRMAHGLQIRLNGFVRSKTATADAKITPLILAALDERERFAGAFRAIYAELGTTFQPVDIDLMPGVLSQAQVRDIEARLKQRADAETRVRAQAASDARAQSPAPTSTATGGGVRSTGQSCPPTPSHQQTQIDTPVD